jgi:hypothetical protein
MIGKFFKILSDPEGFFETTTGESYNQPFRFLLIISSIISIFTPIANYLGWPSTDISSVYQAQILAWRITEAHLIPLVDGWAFLIEGLLIMGLVMILAVFLTVFVHLIYLLIGGKAPLLAGWKAVCYGTAPCVLFGWVPYWSLFMATWAMILQVYVGPKTFYRPPKGRAIWVLSFLIGATLMEFALSGTTVGFGFWKYTDAM